MLTLCALAVALLTWPTALPSARLRRLRGVRAAANWQLPAGRAVDAVAVVACGLLAFWLLGPAGALVGLLFGVVGLRRLRERREAVARAAATRAVTEALDGLVAELRAGAHPASAAESVADSSDGAGAVDALRAIAAAARLGGDVDVVLADVAAAGRPGSAALHRVARAWALAQRHGLPLAEVLDAVRRDLEGSTRFAAQLRAKLAGPRASAAVLACLPVLGLLLGEAMGARPIAVLASTGLGQVLLLLGGLLIAAGIAWSSRLTGRVMPS